MLSGHPEGSFTAVCSDDPPQIGSHFVINILLSVVQPRPASFPLDKPWKIVQVSAAQRWLNRRALRAAPRNCLLICA